MDFLRYNRVAPVERAPPSDCACQILLDGFVQMDKRLLPHSLLPLASGVDHLLSGVHQSHQRALKILLLQGSILIGQLGDELQYIGVLPGNNLFADDLQVPRLAQRRQLPVLHRKLPAVLELHTSQEDLKGEIKEARKRKRTSVSVLSNVPLLNKYRVIWFTPQIADEHLQRNCETWAPSHTQNPALFCWQRETKLGESCNSQQEATRKRLNANPSSYPLTQALTLTQC